MRKFYRSLLAICIIALSVEPSFSQNNFFNRAEASELAKVPGERKIVPKAYTALKLDYRAMESFLATLPQEEDVMYTRNTAPVISLPMPDGSSARFRVWESSIQEPELQAKFPEIRTYAGQGIDDPYATIRFDLNPYFGFRAQILSAATGRIYIDPYVHLEVDHVISYFHADNIRRTNFTCLFDDTAPENQMLPRTAGIQACRGTSLRTFRAAIACTGEYSQAVAGGNAAATHAAIVNSINRITGVFENEIAVRLVLVANNNLIEYTNGATDPFNNVVNGATLTANQNNTDLRIGSANYDIGHIFTSDDSGLALLGCVCSNGNKAKGATGSSVLTGDGFDIDYVAHEMGHQLGANHSYNSDQCASPGGSYEPGGGTTILAYAGICAPQHNIQPSSDPVLHAISYDQINNFLSTSGSICGTNTPNGNTLPVITSVGTNNLSIPINTPFTLTGTATDADGDALTYSWEGWDAGNAGLWTTAATTTNRPLFRSRLPKTTGERNFPDMRVIVANYPGLSAPVVMDGLRGEVLPAVARDMKFRLTVRDNRAGGAGVVSSGGGCQTATNFIVKAVGNQSFRVIAPNGGESYVGGSTQNIQWAVSGTDATPVNVSHVKISLSVDGGFTYPHVLAASTPNDGAEDLVIPAVGPITTARIKIEAIDNIFFDISNNNFNITGATTPTFNFDAPGSVAVDCGSPSASNTLNSISVSGFSTPIVLSASGNPGGTTVSFSPNPLTPGSATTVTLNNMGSLSPGTYTVTVTGTAGAVVRTRDLVFEVNTAGGPVITTQPASQSICLGSPVSFNVAATGATAYQWQVSTNGGTSFSAIGGATASTYSVPVTTAGMNNYIYNVVITNQCGTATSNNAVLTIINTPTITTQPANTAVCEGATASFTVTATGNPTYQWQVSTNGGVSFSNIPLQTMNTLNLPSVTSTMNGYQYRVIVTNDCGTLTSSNATLTISAGVNITAQPADASACTGETATFSVTASGPSLTYQWQVSTDGGATYNNITGATSASYTTAAATSGMNNNRYRVVISTTCGSPSTSQAAILTVTESASITTQPADVSVCAGADATFTVAATNATAYQWQVSTDGGATWNNIGGETSTSLTVSGVTGGMNNNQYRVMVTGCGTPAASQAGVLTINPEASITTQPGDVSSCVGGTATITVTGAGDALTYQWQVSTDGGATWNNISGETAASLTLNGITADMDNNQYRVLVSNPCTVTPVTSSAATLTLVSGAAIVTQPVDAEGCAGSTLNFTVVASGAAGYQWQVSTDGGATWNDISGETNATLALTGITSGMNNNQYRVQVAGCGSTGLTSNAVTLTITPEEVITAAPDDVTVCPGSDATFTVTATGDALTYQWQVSTDGGNTFTDMAGETGTTVTVNAVTVGMDLFEYRVVVTGSCGSVTSDAATLTVSGPVAITIQPTGITACENGSGNFTVTADNATAYQWQVSTDGGTTFTNVPGATSADLPLSNITLDMDNNQYQVTVTGACGAVTSTMATLTVNPAPDVQANGPVMPVCAGDTIVLTGAGASVYSWDNGVLDNEPFAINQTTTFTVTGTDALGCSNTSSVTVTVNQGPVVTITSTDMQIAPGETATLTASPAGADAYVWYFNGSQIMGANDNTITIAEPGIYAVEVTGANGCISRESIEIIPGTLTYSFITPNVNNGTFRINYPNAGLTNPNRVVTIYDEKGSLVYKQAFVAHLSINLEVIEMRVNLSRGAYWVMLSEASGKRLEVGKMIVH